jgi:hypothetical protein
VVAVSMKRAIAGARAKGGHHRVPGAEATVAARLEKESERAEAAEDALGEAQLKVAEERDRAEEERALRLRIQDAVQEDRTKERAAQTNLRAEEQHRLEVQRASIAANQKLESLRSGLKAEVERTRLVLPLAAGAFRDSLGERIDRLRALLDASEDAGPPKGPACPRCNGERMVSPTDVCPACGGSGEGRES